MGFELEYKIDGRKVSLDEWTRHLADEAQKLAADELKTRISRLRCATHGKSPTLTVGRKVGSKIEMKVEACCDEMLERAQQLVGGR